MDNLISYFSTYKALYSFFLKCVVKLIEKHLAHWFYHPGYGFLIHTLFTEGPVCDETKQVAALSWL